MDGLYIEKINTINKSNSRLVLHQKLQYALAALTFILFCSCPIWLPALSSLLKVFLFVFLPKIGSALLSSKIVFGIGNLIIALLVIDSKLFSSKSSTVDVYYEYVEGSQKRPHEGQRNLEVNEGMKYCKPDVSRDHVMKEEEEDELGIGDHGRGWSSARFPEVEREEENSDGAGGCDDDAGGDPASTCLSEELSRRADEFIARVNSQMRLELCFVDHYDTVYDSY